MKTTHHRRSVSLKLATARKTPEREKVKALASLLPKITLDVPVIDYLAHLDAEDRKRYMLRQYFRKLQVNNRPMRVAATKMEFVVLTKPFPQIFEYKPGDDELFQEMGAVRFTAFRSAYKLLRHLLNAEIVQAKALRVAGYYKNPRKTETTNT